MAKSTAALALFLALNLLFFNMASACGAGCPTPKRKLKTIPIPSIGGTCPRDVLQLGVCVNLLNLVKVKVGNPPVAPCCSLIKGLVDLEAAACLCTTIKANALGIKNLNIPLDLSLVARACGKKVPKGFICSLEH